MSYVKTVWVNDTTPAISADNLNKIENGIFDAIQKNEMGYKNLGIVDFEDYIQNFSFPNTFNDTGYLAKAGHTYTVVFTPLTDGTYTVGVISGGAWTGKVSVFGTSGIATFTATANGNIQLRRTTGTAQTIAEMYIFDVTNDAELQTFLSTNKINSVYLPYSSGMGHYLENKFDSEISELHDIVGNFLQPLKSLSNFELELNAFFNTNCATQSGHRYTVVFEKSLNDNETISIGSLSGGAWKESVNVYGTSGIATFNATADGTVYFKMTTGTTRTVALAYIFDTTDDDVLAFVEANLLDSPNVLYGGVIADSMSGWYNLKSFAALGDSITKQAKWIPYVNKNFAFKTIINCGIGGSSVAGSSEDAFWQDDRVNSIPTTADFITIMGGTNDGQAQRQVGEVSRNNFDTETFVGAYNVLISKILYKFTSSGSGYYNDVDYSNITRVLTTKPIYILLITCGFCGKTSAAGEDFSRMENLANACIEIGKLWGLPVADIYHNAGVNAYNFLYYLPDEVHPNDLGGKRIASIISGEMKKIEPIE